MTNKMAALTVAALCAASATAQLKDAPTPPAGFPKFQVQEIATDLKIGYAVITCDVNGDGKPDIVVVDKERVVWYENPTWKVRTIITGKTKPDNVCIAALDIDGDGKIDFVLGAGWRPTDTKTPGTLQWLSRGKTLDEEWTVHPIPCDEPTVHRVKVAELESDGKPQIIVAPLQGRDSTAKGNWLDGRPVRILAYRIPEKPTTSAAWKPQVLSEQLHVVHNFVIYNPTDFGPSRKVLTASYEGISRTYLTGDNKWKTERLHEANQVNPKSSRGASEIKQWMDDGDLIATIEPWHGNQVCVYTCDDATDRWSRHLIDDHLRWGHAITRAYFNNDVKAAIVVGVRDNPDPKQGDSFTEKRGVRIYRNIDGKGEKWDRYLLEDGGVAVEDLTVADLDGDGKPDIIAVGRQTGNCRIYWNKGK